MSIQRIAHWLVVVTWLALVATACTLYVQSALEGTAVDPEIYVQSPAFHIVSFFVMFGLPLLFVLVLMLFVVRKRTSKSSEVTDEAQGDSRARE